MSRYSSAKAYGAFASSLSQMAPNLVEGCALWHNQQMSYKGLLLVAFSGKTQIVQVAPDFTGFWWEGTSKVLFAENL